MQRDKFAQAVLLLVVIFPLVIVLHGENILLILSTGFAGQELGRTQNQVDWKDKDLHAEGQVRTSCPSSCRHLSSCHRPAL